MVNDVQRTPFKLINLIPLIDNVDENLIIFQKNLIDIDSEIELLTEDIAEREANQHEKYIYFIEVFLAKEFIYDWVNSLNYVPTNEEIANRLLEYVVNDA